jgi:hypothetical protein
VIRHLAEAEHGQHAQVHHAVRERGQLRALGRRRVVKQLRHQSGKKHAVGEAKR